MTLILHIYQAIVAQDYLKESADTQESENVIFFICFLNVQIYIILSLLNPKQWFMFMDNICSCLPSNVDCTLWKSKTFDLFLTI